MWMGAGEICAGERRRVRCLLEQKGQSRERERERALGRVGWAGHVRVGSLDVWVMRSA
jgi:hypothetical protein